MCLNQSMQTERQKISLLVSMELVSMELVSMELVSMELVDLKNLLDPQSDVRTVLRT